MGIDWKTFGVLDYTGGGHTIEFVVWGARKGLPVFGGSSFCLF